MASVLFRNATILTMDDRLTVADGSVSVRDGRIAAVGDVPDQPHDTVIDARGGYLLPGFIQTHVHLCQTLFRGFADDMPLLEWLRLRVWPMEAAHSPSTLRASAQLAAAELLRTGTTAVLTMETVHDTDVVFEALAESGLRATIGGAGRRRAAAFDPLVVADTLSRLHGADAARADAAELKQSRRS